MNANARERRSQDASAPLDAAAQATLAVRYSGVRQLKSIDGS